MNVTLRNDEECQLIIRGVGRVHPGKHFKVSENEVKALLACRSKGRFAKDEHGELVPLPCFSLVEKKEKKDKPKLKTTAVTGGTKKTTAIEAE